MKSYLLKEKQSMVTKKGNQKCFVNSKLLPKAENWVNIKYKKLVKYKFEAKNFELAYNS